MIFFVANNHTEHFEEEEEEGAIDDALLGELDDELGDEELLDEELDPLLKADAFGTPEDNAIEGGAVGEDGKIFDDEDEDDDEDMDYDSFDDHDEL